MGRKKGSNLEEAVAVLEESILQEQFKGIDKSKILITTNKKFLNGRHEIDVFVEINPESEYSSKFFIECKDWIKPVGTSVVNNLETKIKKLGATKGFLVARKFSKHVPKQANEYGIGLVKANNNTDLLLKMPSASQHNVKNSYYVIFFDGEKLDNKQQVNEVFKSKFEGVTLYQYLENIKKEELIKGAINHIDENYSGDNLYKVNKEIFWEEGEFEDLVNKKKYQRLSIHLFLEIWFSKSKLIYDYDFSQKGKRIIKQEILNENGQNIPLHFILNLDKIKGEEGNK